jgi:putative peptidoglycan lipid II flippase
MLAIGRRVTIAAEPRDPGTGTFEAVTGEPVAGPAEPPRAAPGRLARSTAFFSFATGLSRIAGLVREIVAASYFGVKGPMSAFTIAFQVPNLVRSLFADQAIQAALLPVFAEHLERGERREAFRLVSTLIFAFILIIGALTAVFILVAPAVIDVFAPGFEGRLEDLTVALSRLLFPIVLMLGVSGLVVGVLNSYDRFAMFAIAPFFWNVAIIAVLVGLAPAFPERDRIYAYAIGVLVGTALQLALVSFDLRNTPFRLQRVFAWTPDVRKVLLLMLPVTISLGLINFNLVINSLFGTLVSDRAPAAIDKAFRIYMLPQGMFSVAVATVVFPTLSRFAARRAYDDLRATMANGMRQIVLLLLPAAAAILVLSEPMIRLVYERGEFGPSQTQLVATALFWFAFSLPFNGLFLLLTRTFFSLQRPWVPTAISAGNLTITAVGALALYGPFGVGGIVAATAIATAASVTAQCVILRDVLGGLELGRLIDSSMRIGAASAALAGVCYGVWSVLDDALGRSLMAQIIEMGAALGAGLVVYIAALAVLRVPELEQIRRLVRRGR